MEIDGRKGVSEGRRKQQQDQLARYAEGVSTRAHSLMTSMAGAVEFMPVPDYLRTAMHEMGMDTTVDIFAGHETLALHAEQLTQVGPISSRVFELTESGDAEGMKRVASAIGAGLGLSEARPVQAPYSRLPRRLRFLLTDELQAEIATAEAWNSTLEEITANLSDTQASLLRRYWLTTAAYLHVAAEHTQQGANRRAEIASIVLEQLPTAEKDLIAAVNTYKGILPEVEEIQRHRQDHPALKLFGTAGFDRNAVITDLITYVESIQQTAGTDNPPQAISVVEMAADEVLARAELVKNQIFSAYIRMQTAHSNLQTARRVDSDQQRLMQSLTMHYTVATRLLQQGLGRILSALTQLQLKQDARERLGMVQDASTVLADVDHLVHQVDLFETGQLNIVDLNLEK